MKICQSVEKYRDVWYCSGKKKIADLSLPAETGGTA